MQGTAKVTQINGLAIDPEYNDGQAYDEIFNADVYRMQSLLVGGGRVVDVGANCGYFAAAMRANWPDSQIVCVETEPRNVEVLKRNAESIGGVAVVDNAMWYGAPKVWRHSTIRPGGSKCSGGSFVWTGSDKMGDDYECQGEIETVTLEQVLDHYGWESCDVLKLDCEGAEFNILSNLDASRVWQIVGECHGVERFKTLMAGLMAPGGKFHGWSLEVSKPDAPLSEFWLTRPRE